MEEKGYFWYFENVSEHATLVQLIDSLGNVNRAVSVVCKWIFIQIDKNPYHWPLNHWI